MRALRDTAPVLFLLAAAVLAVGAEAWLTLAGGAAPGLLALQAGTILALAVAAVVCVAGARRPQPPALPEQVADALRDRRARAALQNAPTNVMLVDTDHTIVFMNEAVKRLFRAHVSDFRTVFPGFDPDAIVGRPMGQFHRDAAGHDRMVAALTGSHATRVTVGTRRFDLTLTPVTDEDGTRLGTMLDWRDVTAEVGTQEDIAAVIHAAAEGDFTRRVAADGRTGFLRDLAQAINELCSVIDGATRDITGIVKGVASGDLTRSVTRAYDGQLGELKDAVNGTIGRLASIVATLQATATDVASAARQINSCAEDLSQRTEEQASSLEETASTAQQLASSVKASAVASREAVTLAKEAMTVAGDGGSIVTQAIGAMTRIEQASHKITDFTTVIDDIAFQTSLLALNAAVEAARAGEAGKGFAVVASEVRSLAQRSADAAKGITGLVQSSSTQIAEGVGLVRSAGDALGKIVEASQNVVGTVSNISQASAEQASGIDEMSQAVERMDDMTQQNAALAEESAASAASLLSQIQQLNALVATFRTGQDVAAPAVPEPAEQPRTGEPDRLRRLAAEAFTSRPSPRRRTAAGGGGWDAF